MKPNTSSTQAASSKATLPAIGAKVAGKKILVKDPFARIPTFASGGEANLEKQRFVLEKGQTLAGQYIVTRSVPSTNKNPDGSAKLSLLHILRDANGQDFGIWGTGTLDATMVRVPKKSYVEVTYNGKEPRMTPYSSKPTLCHAWAVGLEDGVEFIDKVDMENVAGDDDQSAAQA